MKKERAIVILEQLKDDRNEYISLFEEGPSVTGKYIDEIEAIDIAIDAIKKSKEES